MPLLNSSFVVDIERKSLAKIGEPRQPDPSPHRGKRPCSYALIRVHQQPIKRERSSI